MRQYRSTSEGLWREGPVKCYEWEGGREIEYTECVTLGKAGFNTGSYKLGGSDILNFLKVRSKLEPSIALALKMMRD